MNYIEAIEYIRQTHKFGTRLGLACIQELLNRLGNPHRKYRTVHVAGTNGKGSVTTMLTHVFYESGYNVGMYTSPSLERFTERIKVNLSEIKQDDVARIVSRIKTEIDDMIKKGYCNPTEFEIVTALGFIYFAEQNIDIAIIEVGLGGRLDATNVVSPLVSVITSIGFDHMEVLGSTLGEIAFEKAGIIKESTPAVVCPQDTEAIEVVRKVALLRHSELHEVSLEQLVLNYSQFGEQSFSFEYQDEKYNNIILNLSGYHQIINAATALTAIVVLKKAGLTLHSESLCKAFKSIHWPGRLEKIRSSPDIILDGAHNAPGAAALARLISEYFCNKRLILVIGILRDKQADTILSLLCPKATDVIVTMPNNERAIESNDLGRLAFKYNKNVHIEPDAFRAIDIGIGMAEENDVLLITGSLYLVGAVRKYILDKF